MDQRPNDSDEMVDSVKKDPVRHDSTEEVRTPRKEPRTQGFQIGVPIQFSSHGTKAIS